MRGLYIHIPFCAKKCTYCDFVSYANSSMAESYAKLIVGEMSQYAKLLDARLKTIDTIFIGGGTPSLLLASDIYCILNAAAKFFSISSDAEITIECNPESASRKKLMSYFDFGINRLSMGLQSTSQRLLDTLGRIHTVNRFETAINDAIAAGFTNINVDLMYGLPTQSVDDFLETISYAVSLPITHISAYSLILEEDTPLKKAVTNGFLTLPDDDLTANMQDLAIPIMQANGFMRYEVSNYAKLGYECAHNVCYWHNGEYLGLGVAAHSALSWDGWRRFCNVTSLEDYLRFITDNKRPIAEESFISRSDEMFECMMMGMRLVRGVSIAKFTERFGITPSEAYGEKLSSLIRRGLVKKTNEYIHATAYGFDVLNSVLCELI